MNNPLAKLSKYYLRHLTAHLAEAGQIEKLHRLLALETNEAHNAWYEIKEANGEIASYISDVKSAWDLTEQPIPSGVGIALQVKNNRQDGDARIGLQCRYALIMSSFTSLADKMPLALLVTLVEKEIFSQEKGLFYARLLSNGKTKAEALSMLAPHLPKPLQSKVIEEGLRVVKAIKGEIERAEALALLASRLPEHMIAEALAVARAIEDADCRAVALAGLLPRLPKQNYNEVLYEALAAAFNKAWIPEYEREQAEKSISKKEREGVRAEALALLASRLPEHMIAEALAVARAIEDADCRAVALAGLLPRLPKQNYNEVLGEALTAARAVGDENSWSGKKRYKGQRLRRTREEALAGLSPLLPDTLQGEVIEEALTMARAIKNADCQATALAGLAPYLPEQLIEEVLEVAQAIGNNCAKVTALVGLLPFLRQSLKREVLEEALSMSGVIGDEDHQTHVLSSLVSYLPDPLRHEVLGEVLAAALKIKVENWRYQTLLKLLPFLSAPLKAKAQQAVSTLSWDYGRSKMLGGPYPSSHLVFQDMTERKAFEMARLIDDESSRWTELAFLATQLANLPFSELSPLWCETLNVIAKRNRQNLLTDFRAMIPIIAALGGKEAMVEIFHAIKEVGRWWP